MSRQDKTLPPRGRRAPSDVSLLIRSAETLGKMIGALQRQLDGASKKLYGQPIAGSKSWNAGGDGHAGRSRTKPATSRSAAPGEAPAPRASTRATPKIKTAAATASAPSRARARKRTAAPRRGAGKNTKGGRRTS